MQKVSQVKVKNNVEKSKKLSQRLSGYRDIFVSMALRTGLTIEEVALIFGTTKQNVSLISKKEHEN